jgi:3-oxoacyl-[acyl-carrier-protein] synthase II
MGILSPNGVDKDAFRDGLRGGKSGIRRVAHMDVSKLGSKIAGFIDQSVVESLFQDKEAALRHDRTAIFALIAAQRAAADARLEMSDLAGLRTGLLLGSAFGPVASIEEYHETLFASHSPHLAPSLAERVLTGFATTALTSRFGLNSVCLAFAHSTSASLNALAVARQLLLSGSVDLLFVGGVDCPVQPRFMRVLDATRALARDHNDSPTEASRPFERSRSGIVLSEGCGFLVLERGSGATQRNADIQAEIAGAGWSVSRASDIDARAEAMAACMSAAIENAGLKLADIQHIQANADGDPEGDLAEARAIQKVFGQRTASVPVGSIKGMIGHTMGASGVIAVVAEILSMRNNFLAPTLNLEERDPLCALDVVGPEARRQVFDTALVNSFGQDGACVSLVVKKA